MDVRDVETTNFRMGICAFSLLIDSTRLSAGDGLIRMFGCASGTLFTIRSTLEATNAIPNTVLILLNSPGGLLFTNREHI